MRTSKSTTANGTDERHQQQTAGNDNAEAWRDLGMRFKKAGQVYESLEVYEFEDGGHFGVRGPEDGVELFTSLCEEGAALLGYPGTGVLAVEFFLNTARREGLI